MNTKALLGSGWDRIERRRWSGSGEELPQAPHQPEPGQGGNLQTTGAAESEFEWDGKRWQPKTYNAALELLTIALQNVKGRVDLVEHIVNGDGRSARFVSLDAMPEAMNAVLDEIDAAYNYALFAANAAEGKPDTLRPLMQYQPPVREQLMRMVQLVARANQRAEVEGFEAGYIKGWNDSLEARGSFWTLFFETMNNAIDTGGEAAKKAIEELPRIAEAGAKAAPWIAAAILGAAYLLLRGRGALLFGLLLFGVACGNAEAASLHHNGPLASVAQYNDLDSRLFADVEVVGSVDVHAQVVGARDGLSVITGDYVARPDPNGTCLGIGGDGINACAGTFLGLACRWSGDGGCGGAKRQDAARKEYDSQDDKQANERKAANDAARPATIFNDYDCSGWRWRGHSMILLVGLPASVPRGQASGCLALVVKPVGQFFPEPVHEGVEVSTALVVASLVFANECCDVAAVSRSDARGNRDVGGVAAPEAVSVAVVQFVDSDADCQLLSLRRGSGYCGNRAVCVCYALCEVFCTLGWPDRGPLFVSHLDFSPGRIDDDRWDHGLFCRRELSTFVAPLLEGPTAGVRAAGKDRAHTHNQQSCVFHDFLSRFDRPLRSRIYAFRQKVINIRLPACSSRGNVSKAGGGSSHSQT